MSTVEKCPRCGATAPIIQNGECGGCEYSRSLPVVSIPDSRTGRRDTRTRNQQQADTMRAAYRNPPTGPAKQFHDSLVRSLGFEEDHSVTGRGRNESIKRSHRAEGRNWTD